MEQQPRNEEELRAEQSAVAAERDHLIDEAVEHAWNTGRSINDLTAKRIARTLTPGSGAMQAFVESGAILENMETELEIACEVSPELKETWIAAFDQYCRGRLMKTELPYWNDASME